MNPNPNKHETHIEGVKYASKYLSDRGINTNTITGNRTMYLKSVGGELDNKTITVGSMREHDSYLMAKTPGVIKYDYNIVITGLRYNIKRVFIMHDVDARTLANNTMSGNDKDGRITQKQLSPYRDAVLT